jgi:O-antigen ligase
VKRIQFRRADFAASASQWLAKHSELLPRAAIVVAVVFVSAFLAPRAAAGHRLASAILLVYPVAGIALVLLKWPAVGLLALVAASLYVPGNFVVGTGTILSPPVLIVPFLFGVWFLDMVVRQKRLRIIYGRPVLAVGALVVIAVLSFGIGQLPWFPFANQAPLTAQLGGLAVFALSGMVFVLAAHQITNLRWLQVLTWTLLVLGSLYILGGVFPALGTHLWMQRGASGSVFWIWLVALAFSQAVSNRDLKPGWRIALLCLVVAALGVAWFRSGKWVSGWAPPLVAVAVIVWLRSWRLGLLVSLIGAAMVLVFEPGLYSSVAEANDYSINTRWIAWQIALEISMVNPLLGLGPANYYHYTPLFPILGWYVRFNSHSQYVDLVAQTGLLGLIVYLWIFWELARLGWRLRTRLRPGFALAYVHGALAGLAGMFSAGFLVDWILPFVYNIGLNGLRASLLGWLFLGGLLAIDHMTGTQAQQPQPGQSGQAAHPAHAPVTH